MIILGYIFTIINYFLYCLSRFMRDKKDMLLVDLLAKIFTILGLYCLGSLGGSLSFGITFFLLIAANIKERLNKKWILGFLFFQILYTATLFFTYQGISSILIFIVSSLKLTSTWWFVPQKIRIVGMCNSILFLGYQISIKNWAGLLEIFVMLSNFTAYLKYRLQKSPSRRIKKA